MNSELHKPTDVEKPSATPSSTSGNKRLFSYLYTDPLVMKETDSAALSTEESVVPSQETESNASNGVDRTAKRSRKHSPVAEGRKSPVPEPEASPGEPCLLPIIVNAELPDPKGKNMGPDKYLLKLIEAQFGISVKPRSGLDLGDDYFIPVTEKQQAAYTLEVLTPARDNDVETLHKLVQERGRQVVDCSNRFGESLLNLGCRRGFTELVEFLLSKEVDLNVRIKDDFGRTPMHDACWHPKPQLDICSWLMKKDPSLLLVTDKRGSTPFQYARAEDWPTWRQFLFDNRESLQLLTEPSTLKRFS